MVKRAALGGFCGEFRDLPQELVCEILQYLNPRDRANASAVCTAWATANREQQRLIGRLVDSLPGRAETPDLVHLKEPLAPPSSRPCEPAGTLSISRRALKTPAAWGLLQWLLAAKHTFCKESEGGDGAIILHKTSFPGVLGFVLRHLECGGGLLSAQGMAEAAPHGRLEGLLALEETAAELRLEHLGAYVHNYICDFRVWYSALTKHGKLEVRQDHVDYFNLRSQAGSEMDFLPYIPPVLTWQNTQQFRAPGSMPVPPGRAGPGDDLAKRRELPRDIEDGSRTVRNLDPRARCKLDLLRLLSQPSVVIVTYA